MRRDEATPSPAAGCSTPRPAGPSALSARRRATPRDTVRHRASRGRCTADKLTEHVLASWFCQQEMLCAIAEGKKVQLVLEDEPRFNPFDVAAWEAGRGQPTRTVQSTAGLPVVVPPLICEMIDEHLPDAVTYRRRDFEADSMVVELCARNGLVLYRCVLSSHISRCVVAWHS